MNDKDPEWLAWEKGSKCPYFHIFGRICKSEKCFNPSTLPLIQHQVIKEFETSADSSTLFQNGIYMEWNHCSILVEFKSFHSVASVKVALSIDDANDSVEEVLVHLKESGQYIDTIFTKIVCGIAEKQTPSSKLKRKVISLECMKQGDDTVSYNFNTILKRWKISHQIFKPSSKKFKDLDEIVSLLTLSEMKMERQRAEVCI